MGKAEVESLVKAEDVVLGTFAVSNGSVVWFPSIIRARCANGKRKRWDGMRSNGSSSPPATPSTPTRACVDCGGLRLDGAAERARGDGCGEFWVYGGWIRAGDHPAVEDGSNGGGESCLPVPQYLGVSAGLAEGVGDQFGGGAVLRRLIVRGRIGPRLQVDAIAQTFKRVAEFVGMTEEEIRQVSGHSIRVGAAQDMVAFNIDLASVMRAGRWKTTVMPMRYEEKVQAGRGGMARTAKAQGCAER